MKIALGCDHGGLVLKNALIPFLRSMGHTVEDFGTYTEESCDYPDFAAAAAQAVADGDCDRGIVICTTGIGVSIVANKIKGIRCALLSDLNSARLTRLHNDTNMMALGAAVVNQDLAFAIVDAWLSTRFSDEDRHQRRIDKMMACERGLKKKRRLNNKRRHSSLLGKLITLLLSLLLVVSMILTPLTTYITNLADPARIVDILLSSDIFKNSFSPEEPTEVPTELPSEEPSETPSETPSEQPSEEASEEPSTGGNDENSDPATQSDEPAVIAEETTQTPADNGEADALDEETTEAATEETTEAATEAPTETPTEEATEAPTEAATEIAPTEPPANTSKDSDVNALFGALQDMIGADMMDHDVLHSELNLPEGSSVDTEKLGAELLTSGAADALLNAYVTDVLSSAAGTGDGATLTGDTAMEIIAPHMGELTDIVASCLPVEVDRATLEAATLRALEVALPALVDALPDVGEAIGTLSEQVPYLDVALKTLNFINVGGLRACALLLLLVLIVIMCLFRLPGLRGMFCVGICGVIGAMLCGGVYLLLTMPTLNELMASSAGEFSVLITEFAGDFAREYARYAVIYGVIGALLALGTTVLRGFFSMIFNAIFRN